MSQNRVLYLTFSLSSLLVFALFILVWQPSTVAAVDPFFQKCSVPTTCGGQPIRFPFYTDNESCGYPGFRLSCINQTRYLNISDAQLIVHEILYTDQSIQVSDASVLGSGQGQQCFPQIRNFSVEENDRFNLAPGQRQLFMLSNCNITSSAARLSNYRIDCPGEDLVNSSLALFGDDPLLQNITGLCRRVVEVPVAEGGDGGRGYRGWLERGFVLEWMASDCSVCNTSGGICGFNHSNLHFRCFCPDRPHSRQCHSQGSRHGLKLGIGIGGSAILLILLFSISWRLYKLKHTTSFCLRGKTSNLSSRSDLEDGGVYPGVHIFSYRELEEATNNFDCKAELGDGGFGTVFYGKLKDGREVAIKRLYQHNYRRVEQFMNEVEILACLRHKNLVSLYGCTSRRSRELVLVYEYVSNGTVADHLHGDRAQATALTWPIRMSIARETASALAYLHASDVIHRDVKTSNILLDDNFGVKVADFGLSRLFPNDVTHISTAPQGTPGYVDPEYYQCYQLTDKSDVYSFGVMLIELISSMPAVDTSRHRQEVNLANLAINRIQARAVHELIDPCLWHESKETDKRMITAVAELAFQCLQQEKEIRPTMDEVLEELKRIPEMEYKSDNMEDTNRSNDEQGSLEVPSSSPCYDEDALLKSIKQPPSPISVTDKWISRSTTPNISE